MRPKVLFLIHDLGRGGAEKVLVNLVNHMDPEQFDITVMALFGGGVNEQFLKKHVKYRTAFPKMIPGNSHLMKLFSPKMLHRMLIHEHYDIEVAYLEGPCARIISGCPDSDTKMVSWIHCTMKSLEQAASSFRSKEEAVCCYNNFDRIVFVSANARDAMLEVLPLSVQPGVLYNVTTSKEIIDRSGDPVPEMTELSGLKLVGVGKLEPVKGFERLLDVIARLSREAYSVELLILGKGSEESKLRAKANALGISRNVHFLGYQENPYKYVSRCDLFVCSSYSEGFSTAATEALIVGTPVCTTEVSGMREMLGDSEYGLIVDNSEEALYEGIKRLLDDPSLLEHYREMAAERGKQFSTERTAKAVEEMLLSL